MIFRECLLSKYRCKLQKDRDYELFFNVTNIIDEYQLNRYLIRERNIDIIKYMWSKGVLNEDCILTAIEFNNKELVEFFLDNGVNIHYRNDVAIITAAEVGNLDILLYLIDKGADIHVNRDDIMHAAVYGNNIEVIRTLLNMGVSVMPHYSRIMYDAIKQSPIDIIRLLLDNSGVINPQNTLFSHLAIIRCNIEIFELLLDRGLIIDYKSHNTLGIIIEKGEYEMLRYLKGIINQGVATRELLLAVQHSRLEILKYLIENGQDPNSGCGKLLVSTISNECEDGILELLIDKGADIHINNDEPLIQAIRMNNHRAIRLLLDRGSEIYLKNDNILISAILNNDSSIMDLLLNKGFSIHNMSAELLRCAIDSGLREMVIYLLKKGAHIKTMDEYKSLTCNKIIDSSLKASLLNSIPKK
jgi:ankyrin repeat protein